MLEIKTGDLKSRKKVLIDGHPYSVRKLGAGEELALSQKFRRLKELEKKEKNGKKLTQAEESEAEKLGLEMIDVTAACFDDGGDGSKSRALVAALGPDDMQAMQDAIFADKTLEPAEEQSDGEAEAGAGEEPEAPAPDTSSQSPATA